MEANSKLSDILESWNHSRANLDGAIQTFLETTKALTAALPQSPNQDADAVLAKTVIETIYFDFQYFDLRFKTLDNARGHLANIRNRSITQIPLNRLPSEIITRIFYNVSFGSCPCNTSATLALAPEIDIETLFTLPHVCGRWRAIALDTPYLWSHVVFKSKRGTDFIDRPNRIQLWLERARDSKLYIHLIGRVDGVDARWEHPRAIDRQLRPHLGGLVGVSVQGQWYDWDKIMSFWGEGDANSLEEFIHAGNYLSFNLKLKAFSPLPLPHLRVLCLQAMHFSWDSHIYSNLVDLRLGFLAWEDFPTMCQLLDVLSACPDLRVFGLHGWARLKSEEYHSGPVLLKSLELLDITDIKEDGIATLLPMLSFGQMELSVKFYTPDICTEDCVSAIQSLLTRANVTRLFIRMYNYNITPFLTHATNLRVLILDLQRDGSNTALESMTLPTNPRLAVRPELRSLYLLNGNVSKDVVKALAEAHSLKSLTFGNCSLWYLPDDTLQWLEPTIEQLIDSFTI
ncbi:hypothetical protein BDV93DRAFT_611595 [Ceratobasidium sp. AG-I]|nr:hypothetical protein BDV93DRAFT_611595 [Ceratobasidium sp. AG-I]